MPAILHKKTFQELTTDELYELLKVRSEVFVVEQNCIYQDMDVKGWDSSSHPTPSCSTASLTSK